MKNTIFFIIVALILILLSCKNDNQLIKSLSPETMVSSDIALPQEALEKSISQDQTPVYDRRIIKEGEISFETSDKDETRKIINKGVKESNAYISQDIITDHSYRIENRITIRVPSENFEDLLTRISEMAVDLESKNISATDVTEEYVDVESRLKTKKELENRYKVLLQKARSVDEILKIEKQIGDLRTEIESIEGRYKYLNDRISYSTLTVVFYENTSSGFGFISKFVQGIKNGWKNVLWVIIGLINLWPFLILLATIVFIIMRKRRNKK